ncbi:MAG: hypothetical protein Q8R81_09600 [Novosphingobium sp.]|uniref:DUF6551 family protein n=1 Tax=Novosphingobium sp. TaxID=1874826 RepID=UPI00273283DB|nr:DUF6551 family protein [Novosphingobium sp.]MDP3550639.1 hypothetical protein [Novosphingobium sp.]
MTAPATPKIQIGPQIGAPSSLENVPVGRLAVDATYQRATDSAQSRRIIAGMVKEWNWALCQPLVVSRRDDGALLILDGQHRHAGAVARGDIPYLPCSILSSLDLKGEAKTFVDLNTRRQKLSQPQVFHGMLAAGDEQAKAVLDLIEHSGWRLARTKNTGIWKPGDLECAPALVTIYATKGAAHVSFALNTLRAAYPETAVRQSSTLLHSLVSLFDDLPNDPVPLADLITAIGEVDPDLWLSRGLIYRASHPALTRHAAIAATMLLAAKGEEPPAARPVTLAPVTRIDASLFPPSALAPLPKLASPAPAKAPGMTPQGGISGAVPLDRRSTAKTPPGKREAFAFDTTGKGWCGQCDQRVSREKASACADRFCHARPHT